LDLPAAEFTLQIDPDLMEQVFINLLKNSKEAILDNKVSHGKIELSIHETTGGGVSISDNGGGIPPDVLENIFIPFYTTKETGSGVGLSLVKQIVQLHKGDIEIDSDVNEGTTAVNISL